MEKKNEQSVFYVRYDAKTQSVDSGKCLGFRCVYGEVYEVVVDEHTSFSGYVGTVLDLIYADGAYSYAFGGSVAEAKQKFFNILMGDRQMLEKTLSQLKTKMDAVAAFAPTKEV